MATILIIPKSEEISKQDHSTNQHQRAVLGNYQYDDQGFRVRRIAQKADVDGTIRTVELQYHNQYYAFERQLSPDDIEVPNTHSGVNNVYLNGVRIAAESSTGMTRYFLSDQVDSVHVVADEFGTAISRSEYLPYGEEWVKAG